MRHLERETGLCCMTNHKGQWNEAPSCLQRAQQDV